MQKILCSGLLLTLYLCLAYSQHRQASPPRGRLPTYYGVPSALPDGWEAWSEWTPCSRTCGGGVTEQRRTCRRRPRQENLASPSHQCSGSNKKYRSCNSLPCPDGSVNSRRAKCAEYNTRLFSGNTYVWEPMARGGPCELSCRARGHRFFVRHASRVTDGTDCSYTVRNAYRYSGRRMPKHICVEGRCLVTGCDGTLGSGMVEDQCGVCGGNGQSCEVIDGRFRLQNLANDFHVIAKIPAGSTRINITETRSSRSYLALRSSSPDGKFYINGNLKVGHIDKAGIYVAAGVQFNYSRPYPSTKGESLYSHGPTNEDLDLLLYFQGENPGILYQFMAPNLAATPPAIRRNSVVGSRHVLLDHHDDSDPAMSRPGSRMNFGGALSPFRPAVNPSTYVPNTRDHSHHQPARPQSTNGNNYYRNPRTGFPNKFNNIPGAESIPNPRISGRFPLNLPRGANRNDDSVVTGYDPDEESTNTRRDTVHVNRQVPEMIGETAWRTRGFGPCSKSCAEGVRRAIIRCVRIDNSQEVDDRYCSDPRPKVRSWKCNRVACPPYYEVGQWSSCSRTCGNGRRTRTVMCRQQFPGNFTTSVSHRKCRKLSRPSTHDRCRSNECAHWVVDREWSKCNAKCGTGRQMRRVACKGGNGKTISERRCPAARRPSNIRNCDAGPCVTRWYVTDWEACSADCDRGFQRRNVYCLNTAAAVAGCPTRIKPDTKRTCARSSCGIKHEWFAGSWGPCSSKCGNGLQQRLVTCLNITTDGEMAVAEMINGKTPCEEADKPATERTCNTQSCGSRWHFTPWTKCSVSCGGGSRTRDIQCLDAEGVYSSLCDIQERPIEAERCNTVSCLSLRDPGCEDRSRSCEMFMQAGMCAYAHYREKCCHSCSLSRRHNLRSSLLP